MVVGFDIVIVVLPFVFWWLCANICLWSTDNGEKHFSDYYCSCQRIPKENDRKIFSLDQPGSLVYGSQLVKE